MRVLLYDYQAVITVFGVIVAHITTFSAHIRHFTQAGAAVVTKLRISVCHCFEICSGGRNRPVNFKVMSLALFALSYTGNH